MPIKLTISQQPNGVLFSGSGSLNLFSTYGYPVQLVYGQSKLYKGTDKLAGLIPTNVTMRYSLNILNNVQPLGNTSTLYGISNVINATYQNQSVFSFAVVRNPYTRTYSCFHQFNKTNKTNISFLEYLKNYDDVKLPFPI